MKEITIKCRALTVGDWCCNKHGFPMQITNVGDDYAYATWEGNESDPWEFCDKEGDEPEPIPLTPEILKKNGFKDAEYWCEYKDDKVIIQCRLPIMRGRINEIVFENFKCEYVHQYQHLLRLCGLNELADNFKL